MINLFHIPSYSIDTSRFSNLLHDKIVKEFEEQFAEYVGAKYAVSFNSATSAIFLIFKELVEKKWAIIPSIIPPVVPNAIINAGGQVSFCDNVKWVGDSYLMVTLDDFDIIDSAQKVNKNQYSQEASDDDLMIFSFYPTKPIGSCDGGMVVSNDKDKIERLREATMNGMSFATNNWERKINSIGHKMYMNSLQAFIARNNLYHLEYKKDQLAYVRDRYNQAFGLKNTSDHLYRIQVKNNKDFIDKAKKENIMCGIHYEVLHLNQVYGIPVQVLPNSIHMGRTTVSIPFHEELRKNDIDDVIRFVHENL